MKAHLENFHFLKKLSDFKASCLISGFVLLLFLATGSVANNIQVVNGTLVDQNTSEGYYMVQFDLSWENSWRTDNLFPNQEPVVGNRDAAWIFVKYRVSGGVWQHARLHDTGHSTGSGTPASLDIGLPDVGLPFHPADNPVVGAFIYRSENGSGTFAANDVQLRWNYGVDNIPDTAPLEIKVVAIEMVFVPEGPFSLGSGGNEAGHFHQADHPDLPYQIINEDAITTASSGPGSLWGLGGTDGNDAVAPSDPSEIPSAFPKGFDAFYIMKYSISQQQYVDFLNTLTFAQQDTRIDGSPDDAAGTWAHNAHRHAIKIATPGIDPHTPAVYETDHPYVACNYISWMDGSAYLDWAGLRPYTELEYEKAARGPVSPVPNEYAWGTTTIANTAYTLSDEGNADEAISTNYSSDGNALYGITAGAIGGPVRVGIFSKAISNRVQSGASYWGIMELSGNLSERTVTVGNEAGRDFSALHGNGQLTTDGHGSVANWPGMGIDGITGAEGSGFRGGAWNFSEAGLLVSGRTFAAGTGTLRPINGGFRGARSLMPSDGDYFLNPYEQIEWETVNYYHANLHTHTKYSDGSFDPHEAIDKYHEMGYHILALTDHDISHYDARPTTLYPWTSLEDIYYEIEDKKNWTGRTFSEWVNEVWQDRNPEQLGMLAVEGSELSAGHHIGSFMNDYAGASADEHVSISEVGARDGLAMFYHPGRYDRADEWYIDFYQTYPHLIGMEIYNETDRYPEDRSKWDRILHQLMPDRPVWGFANDDSHNDSHFGLNRNIFLLSDLSIENVRHAMVEGHVYLFVPVVRKDPPDVIIQSIETRGGRIELALDGEFNEIQWITHDPELNESIIISSGLEVHLDNVPSTATFVRAVILSDGGRTYTQPFGIVRR